MIRAFHFSMVAIWQRFEPAEGGWRVTPLVLDGRYLL
jgi:hypothetical protein